MEYREKALLKKRTDICAVNKYGVMFFIISLVGWCFEKIGRYIVYNSVSDRGFLTAPICPIYGCSVILIFFLIGTPKEPRIVRTDIGSSKRSLASNLLIYFLLSLIISSSLEILTGMFFEKVFGISLWNYEDRFFNIGKYISLGYSILWGVLISLFMLFLWEPLVRLTGRIGKRGLFIANILGCSIMLLDFLFNAFYIIRTGEHFNFL